MDGDSMVHPTVRSLLESGGVKTGFWVNEFMTPAIGHILKGGELRSCIRRRALGPGI